MRSGESRNSEWRGRVEADEQGVADADELAGETRRSPLDVDDGVGRFVVATRHRSEFSPTAPASVCTCEELLPPGGFRLHPAKCALPVGIG